MANIFITGATGFIGMHLALRLAATNNKVKAIYRSETGIKDLQHPNIELFKGDLSDIKSLEIAMAGCEYVYHVAAYARAWAKDKNTFYEMNLQGSINVIETAKKMNVKKIVITSTAGVFGPSMNETIHEDSEVSTKFYTPYEHSKALLWEKCLEYSAQGLYIVTVNPTRVYGPGLLNESNSVTKMIIKYIKGKWRILPDDGQSIGNYVYIDDVVEGLIKAMKYGISGNRYLLAGENITYSNFFRTISRISGRQFRLIRLPLWAMLYAAHAMMLFSFLTGIRPLITPSLVRKFNCNWQVSNEKAKRELQMEFLSLDEGVRKTCEWILNRNNKYD